MGLDSDMGRAVLGSLVCWNTAEGHIGYSLMNASPSGGGLSACLAAAF